MHVLNVNLSRHKQAKTHVNRLKQSWNVKEILDRGGEEKIHAAPPSSHFLATPLTACQLITTKHDVVISRATRLIVNGWPQQWWWNVSFHGSSHIYSARGGDVVTAKSLL